MMAPKWEEAQKNERQFWASIYREKRQDVTSYMPVTDETAFAFSKKSVERFGHGLEAIREGVIADVGCGPYGLIRGFHVHAQRSGCRPKRMYGIDSLMDTYLEFGTLPAANYIEYITAKAEAIPLEDGLCTSVYSTNVIDHVERPGRVLSECRRIVAEGGNLFFAVHTISFPFSLLGGVLFLIDRNHPHHFSSGRIRQMASRYFDEVTLTQKVSLREDHPEFTLATAFQSTGRLRALKRWASTLVMSTCYFKCSH